jgi:hypothetical protein
MIMLMKNTKVGVVHLINPINKMMKKKKKMTRIRFTIAPTRRRS